MGERGATVALTIDGSIVAEKERERAIGKERKKEMIIFEYFLLESLMFVAKSLQSCRSHLQYVLSPSLPHFFNPFFFFDCLNFFSSIIRSSFLTFFYFHLQILPTGQQQQQQQRSLQEFYETTVDACDGMLK